MLVAGRGDADGQCVGLDLSDERCAFADDVAVELVVVDAIDVDFDALAGVLVDLVVLLGSPGDQP